MKITEIRGFLLSCALPTPTRSARGLLERRGSLLIEIVTDAGISGWGETWPVAPPAAAHIRAAFPRLLLGADARRIGPLWRAMKVSGGFDQRGSTMMALSGIDMALTDLLARSRNEPIAAFLGGAHRDRVPAYASGPYMAPSGDPYGQSVRDAEATLKRGYRALKPRIGLEPRQDAAMVAAIRKAAGPELTLMVDFNQGYTPRAAIDTARRMEGLDLFWLEEPAGGEDIAGYALVGSQVKAAIAGGEAWGSAAAFRDFLVAGAVDIIQPDLSVAGGFTGLKALSALAEAFDRPLTPHVWGTGIGLYAALQLTAALPPRQGGGPGPFPWIEVDQADYPLAALWGRPDPDDEGMIAVPDGPGLGIDPKPDDFQEWIVDSWTLTG